MKDKTIKELTDLYNGAAKKLDVPTVKKFSSKAIALKRTKAILAELSGKGKNKPGRKAKGLTFPMPFLGEQHATRKTTLRGKFLEALQEGATLNELTAIAKKHYAIKDKHVPAGIVENTIRVMNWYNGFGFKKVGDTIRVVTK